MRDVTRRLNKAEKALNLSEEPKTVTIVLYGDELPPDRIEGNTTIHFVMYENGRATKSNQKQPNGGK